MSNVRNFMSYFPNYFQYAYFVGVVCPEGKFDIDISSDRLIEFIETRRIDCFVIPKYLSTMSLVMRLYALRQKKGYSYKIVLAEQTNHYVKDWIEAPTNAPFDLIAPLNTKDLILSIARMQGLDVITTYGRFAMPRAIREALKGKRKTFCKPKYFSPEMREMIPLPPSR